MWRRPIARPRCRKANQSISAMRCDKLPGPDRKPARGAPFPEPACSATNARLHLWSLVCVGRDSWTGPAGWKKKNPRHEGGVRRKSQTVDPVADGGGTLVRPGTAFSYRPAIVKANQHVVKKQSAIGRGV